MKEQIIFKTKPEEKQRLKEASEKSYQSLSAFVRISALNQADKILNHAGESAS